MTGLGKGLVCSVLFLAAMAAAPPSFGWVVVFVAGFAFGISV